MAIITAEDTRLKTTAVVTKTPEGEFHELKGGWAIEVKIAKNKWHYPFKWQGKTFFEVEWEAHKALHDLREHIKNEGGTIEIG